MDQDSFRKLLQTPRSPAISPGSSHTRGSFLASTTSKVKEKKIEASEQLFKPRKLKKTDNRYRDRAAERRQGGGNDFAHVEALLEDFERRNADNEDKETVEEQRKYLGGDSEHSILVKGLDIALLEQNKARAANDSTEDDDILEQAYREASTTVPKKRTREELIKELKAKRAEPQEKRQEAKVETSEQATARRTAEEEARLLEIAKQQGKFKPIGFKPVGASEEKEKRKKKKKAKEEGPEKDNGERRKKKRKMGDKQDEIKSEQEKESPAAKEEPPSTMSEPFTVQRTVPQKLLEPEPDPLADDFDIFTGAGDYEGIDLGDDEEEEEGGGKSQPQPMPREEYKAKLQESAAAPKHWVAIEDETPPVPSKSLLDLSRESDRSKFETRSPSPSQHRGHEDVGLENKKAREEEEMPIRLQPLESSALPSIRDFLAMDEAAEAAEKRRKRKEKKKSRAGGGGDDGGSGGNKNMEAKVNRDLQRLQSYTSKKEKSNS